MAETPILFDYGGSPVSQKVHLLCAAAGITIKSCEQPMILPRPVLENLGITYRRIPVMAVGKDFFADSSLIIATLLKTFVNKLPTSSADKAFEAYGVYLFELAQRIIPIEILPEAFIQDRSTIFPNMNRSDHGVQRPSAVAEVRAAIETVERQFLGGKNFIGGDEMSLSDVHVAWVIHWYLLGSLQTGRQPGFGREDFPNTYAWLACMPTKEAEKITAEDAVKTITSGPYFAPEHPAISPDPLGLSIGEIVAAQSTDSTPGTHLQKGKLIGLTIDTVTLQLENQLRITFPRRGTIMTKV